MQVSDTSPTSHLIPDHHSRILNVTTRLAIGMQRIPDGVDWSDCTPQGHRRDLTAADILPSRDGSAVLKDRALSFLMNFLVYEFRDLKELRPIVHPMQPPYPVTKTAVVPMKVTFTDEKCAADNVAILWQLVKDAKLMGNDEVCITN